MIILLSKASIILFVLWAFYKLILEKETFFMQNRIYLLGCLVFAFALPFVTLPQLISEQGIISSAIEKIALGESSLENNKQQKTNPSLETIPVSNLESYENSIPTTNYTPEPISKTEQNQFTQKEDIQSEPIINNNTSTKEVKVKSWGFWITSIYLFGVLIFSLHLITQILSILWKVGKSDDKIIDENYVIVNTNLIKEPCSFFKYIFINPESYDYDTYEQILEHEKIHVNQRHSLDLLLAELAVVVLWFNPLVWMFRKDVEKNIEYQSDALLVHAEADEKEQYQLNLLKIATVTRPLTVTTNYNQSLIKQRILKMNTKKSNPHSNWKYAFILPLLFVTVLILNKPTALQAMENLEPLETTTSTTAPIEENENSIIENTKEEIVKDGIVFKKLPEAKESKNLEVTYQGSECKQLETAAKNGDLNKVKSLLETFDPTCFPKATVKDRKNLEMAKYVMHDHIEVFVNSQSGSIIVKYFLISIHDEQDPNFPPYHGRRNFDDGFGIDCDHLINAKAEMDLEKIRKIYETLDPECIANPTPTDLEHLKYMKFLVNNGARMSMVPKTITINTEVLLGDKKGQGTMLQTLKNSTIWSDKIAPRKTYSSEGNSNRKNAPNNGTRIFKFDSPIEGLKELNSASDLSDEEREDIRKVTQLLENLDGENLTNFNNLTNEEKTIVVNILNNVGDEEALEQLEEINIHIDTDQLNPAYQSTVLDAVDNMLNNKYSTNSKGCKSLIQAVKANDISRIIEELKTTDPNCIDHNPEYEVKKVGKHTWRRKGPKTPLVAAAREGNLEIAKILINNGAKIKFHARDDKSPLMGACESGSLELVKLLLEKGASLNEKTEGYGTPLNCAARNGHDNVVEYLLTKDVNINATNDGQGTALNAAARNGHNQSVKILIAAGANINSMNDGQGSALNAAARNGHTETIKILLEAGANVNAQNDGQGSPLNAAARNGHTEAIKLLLAKGANINRQNDGQGSPLNAAARNAHNETVKLLIKSGANVNLQNDGQGSPLNAAARNGHIETARILLENGADINRQNDGQGSPLNAAARNGNLTMVKFLVEHGAQVNARTDGQGTAMEAASKNRHRKVMEYLKSKGAY